MFFKSFLNSCIGTNSVLSCILCSPINVSGAVWASAFTCEWSPTSHPTPVHEYQRKVITAELWRMKELRGMTAAKFSLHTPSQGFVVVGSCSLLSWKLLWTLFAMALIFAFVQELSFTCVVLTRARWQQPGLGFALFVALIKPSLMREPVTFKRAIKSHPVKLPV